MTFPSTDFGSFKFLSREIRFKKLKFITEFNGWLKTILIKPWATKLYSSLEKSILPTRSVIILSDSFKCMLNNSIKQTGHYFSIFLHFCSGSKKESEKYGLGF